jgi:hypothetical protein
MPKYLTVAQYKRFADGVDIGSLSDISLALFIARAEASIDSHMGFDLKRGGFEPHMVMIQSAFHEQTRKSWFPSYPIPVRNIQRYRIQVSNANLSGAGFFATIDPSDCVINNDGRYVEIVPLQAVTYSLSPILIQLGLRPPIVEMDCEVGFYIPVWGERLIDSGDHQTYFATQGFWATTYTQALASQPNQLPPVPPNVYVNGVMQPTTAYTYDPVEGLVQFGTPQSPSAQVSADYTMTIPKEVTAAAVLQTSYLLSIRNLNAMGMYQGMYELQSGEQRIAFPRFQAVADRGRAQETPLCDKASGMLATFEQIAVA